MSADLLRRAVAALRDGLLVAFPTETVYGLGADASSVTALARLYRVKGRPASHPVIVHLADVEQLPLWARDIPPEAYRLAEAFWPGPMTLVLRSGAAVLPAVTGGQDTVGLRIPGHPLARNLITAFDGGIAAPSANRFGRLSPTTAEDVAAELGDDVAMVLDGGPCQVGIESTIIDLSAGAPRILRPGMLLASEIEAVLGKGAEAPGKHKSADANGSAAPRVPGGLPSHYAPDTPLVLVTPAELGEAVGRALAGGRVVAVLSFRAPADVNLPEALTLPAGTPWVTACPDAGAYAAQLYRQLRHLDRQRCDAIFVELPPDEPSWQGILDRLRRAAAPRP